MQTYVLDKSNYVSSMDHCTKWYPSFKEGKVYIEEYQYIAEIYAMEEGVEWKDKDGEELISGYLKNVFGKLFYPNAQNLNMVYSTVQKWKDFMAQVDSVQKETWETALRLFLDRKNGWILADFETWMMTLTAQHLYSYLNEKEANGDPLLNPNTDCICPRCQTKSHFGLLQKDEGYRQLECWLCGYQWMTERIRCPYCNEKSQKLLGFFEVEGIPGARVHFCKSCDQYVKVFDFREIEGFKPVVLLYHLATLTLDDIAVKEGFVPGSGLVWDERFMEGQKMKV